MPTPTPPPTLAFAVLSGFGVATLASLSLASDVAETEDGRVLAVDDWRGCEGGAGDADFRDAIVGADGGIDRDATGGVFACFEGVDVADDPDGGVSNSFGLFLACISVIIFASRQ